MKKILQIVCFSILVTSINAQALQRPNKERIDAEFSTLKTRKNREQALRVAFFTAATAAIAYYAYNRYVLNNTDAIPNVGNKIVPANELLIDNEIKKAEKLEEFLRNAQKSSDRVTIEKIWDSFTNGLMFSTVWSIVSWINEKPLKYVLRMLNESWDFMHPDIVHSCFLKFNSINSKLKLIDEHLKFLSHQDLKESDREFHIKQLSGLHSVLVKDSEELCASMMLELKDDTASFEWVCDFNNCYWSSLTDFTTVLENELNERVVNVSRDKLEFLKSALAKYKKIFEVKVS